MKRSSFRAERLLPIACLMAAVVLIASEAMTMFDFTPPGGETLQTQSAHARHGNAMFVIGGFAIMLTIVAVWGRSRPAALGVAVLGTAALLWFLIGDLPKAGQVGTLDDARASFFDAETVPQAGFWLMLLGSVGLAISGAALATLTEDQLGALRGGDAAEGSTPSGEAGSGAGKQPSSNGREDTVASQGKKAAAPRSK